MPFFLFEKQSPWPTVPVRERARMSRPSNTGSKADLTWEHVESELNRRGKASENKSSSSRHLEGCTITFGFQ